MAREPCPRLSTKFSARPQHPKKTNRRREARIGIPGAAALAAQPFWISPGFPDGGFFGSRKASDAEIDMIEVKWRAL
jgi:hypothetical protein